MPRRINKADFALLVNRLVALSDEELDQALNVRTTLRGEKKKGKKVEKKKPAALASE